MLVCRMGNHHGACQHARFAGAAACDRAGADTLDPRDTAGIVRSAQSVPGFEPVGFHAIPKSLAQPAACLFLGERSTRLDQTDVDREARNSLAPATACCQGTSSAAGPRVRVRRERNLDDLVACCCDSLRRPSGPTTEHRCIRLAIRGTAFVLPEIATSWPHLFHRPRRRRCETRRRRGEGGGGGDVQVVTSIT